MALALEDGSNYAVTRVMATGELYISVTDAQNTLGQGNEWTDYGIDKSTGHVPSREKISVDSAIIRLL